MVGMDGVRCAGGSEGSMCVKTAFPCLAFIYTLFIEATKKTILLYKFYAHSDIIIFTFKA